MVQLSQCLVFETIVRFDRACNLRHFSFFPDEQEQDEADGPYAQNRGQESGENSKTEKERSLEKRVTDLENEVSRLNEELDNLKDLLASNEIGHKKDPAAERNRSTAKEPKEGY